MVYKNRTIVRICKYIPTFRKHIRLENPNMPDFIPSRLVNNPRRFESSYRLQRQDREVQEEYILPYGASRWRMGRRQLL